MNITIENNLGVDLQSTIMVLISTLLIIFIAKKFFWNAVLDYIEKRKAYLEGEYQQANLARKEGDNYRNQYEQELSNAKSYANEIVDHAKLEAQKEYQSIIEQAKKDSSLIIEKAKENIKFERKQAEAQINDRIKEVAFSAAEKMIKKEINDSTKQQYVDEFLEKVNE